MRTGTCCVSSTWSAAWLKHSVNEPWGFPGGSVLKNLPANGGDLGSILGGEDPLEKEMATRSSVLAWEIPRTEEPGRLQSMGSQNSRT